jgi:hypothetical protein
MEMERCDKPVVEFVSVVVGGHNVQQENVLGFGIESRDAELHLRKHLPIEQMKPNVFVSCTL